jgi:hypothetical protein
MASEWHYGQGEEQHGPVALEELKQLVASGHVQPIDMVWNEDMPEWLPASEVEELFPKQETTGEAAGAQQPPSVPLEQPADVVSSPRGRRLSFSTAVIGIAAFCVVGLVVVGSLIYFRNRENLPEEVRIALATLKINPTDPEAKLVVGKYHCFRQDDWDTGLPMLVQGSDATLKELAMAERRKPTVPEEQKKLGDGWWDLAGNIAGLVWKGSQQRAVHWYREALPHLEGSAKVEIEKKLKRLDEQPRDFEVLARRAKANPDESFASAHCTDLTMEVGKKKAGGPGAGHAGLELKGVRFLKLAVIASPNIKWVSKNSFAGFMVDYHSKTDYTRRVALSTGVFDKDRVDKAPRWGKGTVPDEYVDLGNHDQYELDLQQWAPPDWDGQLWLTTTLEMSGGDTLLTAQLIPLAKQQAANKDTTSAQVEKKDDGGKGTSAKVQVVDLLKMIDLARDTVVGTWTVDGASLTSGSKNCALAIPCSVPDEYTVVVVLDRREGKNAFRLGLVVGSRQSMVAIDGFSKDEWASGVSDIDGKPAVTNESKHTGQLLPEGASHTIECTVRRAAEDKARVTATVDGKEVVDWTGEYGRLSYPAKLPVLKEGSKPCLWLQSLDNTFAVSKLELRPIE